MCLEVKKNVGDDDAADSDGDYQNMAEVMRNKSEQQLHHHHHHHYHHYHEQQQQQQQPRRRRQQPPTSIDDDVRVQYATIVKASSTADTVS